MLGSPWDTEGIRLFYAYKLKISHSVFSLSSIIPGRKIERSLSARRKENIDTFIPTKPMLVKSKTLDRPPSKDSWDGQSKSFLILLQVLLKMFFFNGFIG